MQVQQPEKQKLWNHALYDSIASSRERIGIQISSGRFRGPECCQNIFKHPGPRLMGDVLEFFLTWVGGSAS